MLITIGWIVLVVALIVGIVGLLTELLGVRLSPHRFDQTRQRQSISNK
jgi:hypothetical protein